MKTGPRGCGTSHNIDRQFKVASSRSAPRYPPEPTPKTLFTAATPQSGQAVAETAVEYYIPKIYQEVRLE